MSKEARNLGLLLTLATLGLLLAYQIPGDLFFDFGPNDGRYVRGFREDFEVDEPTLIHWSSDRAVVRLPFHLRGDYEVTLRYKRHIAAPAEVRIFFGDELTDTFTVPQQDFTLRDLDRENNGDGEFEMRILSRSDDPRPLGLALDWMQIRPARRFGAVRPNLEALLAMLSWVLALYLVPRCLGFGPRASLLSGGVAFLALAGMSIAHKLWPVHASLTLGLRAHVVTFLLVGFYWMRRRVPTSAFSSPEARWAVLVLLVGLAIRLFALFHPDFYYPDVRTHSKFVSLIYTQGLGGFFADYIPNQHTHLLGLQYVGDRWLAFPYPPLLYMTIYPLSLMQLPVEDWMKLVPTALLAVEGLILFALARKLGIGAKAAALAVLLHATARVLAFRIAVASYAALFGHFWDTVAMVFLVFFVDRIERPRYAAGLAGLVAISILSYAGSALVLGMFVPALCITMALAKTHRHETKRIAAIAGWSLLGALVAIAGFYGQYIPELLPAGDTPDSAGFGELIELRFTPFAAAKMAAHRMNLFYGVVFSSLAVAALFLLRGKLRHPLAFPMCVAVTTTFLGLNFLRAGLGSTHIFQFSKDDLVVLPLVVLGLGMLLETWSRARLGRYIAIALLLGWIAWSVLALAADIQSRFIRPDYEANTTRLPPARLA